MISVLLALLAWAEEPAPVAPAPEEAPAEAAGRDTAPIGFARLVLHSEDGRFAEARSDYRIRFLERLRDRGFDARGGEDLVFGVDKAVEARFLVGGEVIDVDTTTYGRLECEVTVEWQVLDVATEEVVYRVTVHGYAHDRRYAVDGWEIADRALFDAFDRLLDRPKLLAVLQAPSGPRLVAADWDSELRVRRCEVPEFVLPDDMQRAVAGTVVVRSLGSVGSGAMVSPDGFVFTAAHVVLGNETVEVTTSGGLTVPGTPIRVDPFHDVAVVHVAGSGYPCLTAVDASPGIGTELYAVGAPLGEGLEFSVSKGVVSGARAFEDWRYIQTDASINPGNSGGPLLDQHGRLVAVVSWKVAAPGFEGLAFGVPADTVAERLGIAWSEASDEAPEAKAGRLGGAPAPDDVEDEPDASRMGTWDDPTAPPGPRKELPARQRAGIAMVVLGATTVLISFAAVQDAAPGSKDALWTVHALGWGLTAGGALLIVPAHVWKGDATRGATVTVRF